MQRVGPMTFLVADLQPNGELHAQTVYSYEDLEQLDGAAELLGTMSGAVWRSPEHFELDMPTVGARMILRWVACAPGTGIATLRCNGALVSVSILACGTDSAADRITLEALQRHLLGELRDSGYEPAFDVLQLSTRPLLATIVFRATIPAEDQMTAALADRCFAAAYFRYRGLA